MFQQRDWVFIALLHKERGRKLPSRPTCNQLPDLRASHNWWWVKMRAHVKCMCSLKLWEIQQLRKCVFSARDYRCHLNHKFFSSVEKESYKTLCLRRNRKHFRWSMEHVYYAGKSTTLSRGVYLWNEPLKWGVIFHSYYLQENRWIISA